MADDAPKLDPDHGRALAPEPADRWEIALERLARYDLEGESLGAETVMAEFKAAVAARSDSLA